MGAWVGGGDLIEYNKKRGKFPMSFTSGKIFFFFIFYEVFSLEKKLKKAPLFTTYTYIYIYIYIYICMYIYIYTHIYIIYV